MRAIFTFLTFVLATPFAEGQRFLRSSGQARSDAQSQLSLADGELNGMARELFLMSESNIDWELQPPSLSDLDGSLKRHVEQFLDGGLTLKLSKNRGKYGMRAVGTMPNGKKLRAFWRQAVRAPLEPADAQSMSYDDAVCRRLFGVEFEVVLPPLPGKKALPSIIYQIPVEAGRLNPKSIVPRSSGNIKVFPEGRQGDAIEKVGEGRVGLRMGAGIVDPAWAKGRAPFRIGRKLGIL